MEIEERVAALESYRDRHEASIQAWWDQQWRTNTGVRDRFTDHEDRLRVMEKFSNKIVGATATAALIGSALGGTVIWMVLSGGNA